MLVMMRQLYTGLWEITNIGVSNLYFFELLERLANFTSCFPASSVADENGNADFLMFAE